MRIWKWMKKNKKDGCYQVVVLNLYRKEKWGLDKEVYLNNKNFTRKKTKKKDGVGWIVNLKLSKKLKWKWEKKGFCQVVYLKCKRLAKKNREKKDWVRQVVDVKFTKNVKEKKKKKDEGWTNLCIWIMRDSLWEQKTKKTGLNKLWIWN